MKTEYIKELNIFDIVKFKPTNHPSHYTVAYVVGNHTNKDSYTFKTLYSKIPDKIQSENTWTFRLRSKCFDLEVIGNKITNPEYFL